MKQEADRVMEDKNIKMDELKLFEEKRNATPIKFDNAVKIESLKLFIV